MKPRDATRAVVERQLKETLRWHEKKETEGETGRDKNSTMSRTEQKTEEEQQQPAC